MIRKAMIYFSLMLLLAFVGCSDNPTENSQNTEGIDLTSEFGGYTETAEEFAFADAQLITESSDDVDYGDPILLSPGFDSLVEHPQAGKYHMRIVWGKLRYDSTVAQATDWTGSLQITRGGEVIRRIIHWELNQDFILPRTDRTLIEWISFTTVHNDGIAVDLIVPPLPPTFDSSFVWEVDTLGDSNQVLVIDTIPAEESPVEVTFTTGPYTRTFTLEELEALDTIVYVADSNAVAFHALKVNRRECPAGFFNGYWGYNEAGEGVFRGMWVSKEGFITGFVKGHFGVNDEGENVLFGKYVNRNGRFEGFLKGTYMNIPDNSSDSTKVKGKFQARLYDANRMEFGALEGKYRSAKKWEGGFMAGRWKVRCRDSINMNDDSRNDGIE